jgi:hypothetical protein
MARGLAYCVVGALAFVGPAHAGEPPADDAATFRSEFEREGVRFTIEGRVRQVTLASGPGELVCYSVRMDGRFVHPERADGGRLIGCRYGERDVRATLFPDARQPLGWMLSTGSICGNTHSRRVALVTVPRQERGGFAGTYVETTFDCKRTPLFRPAASGLEVWAEEQDWGRGGTSSSIVVPFAWLVPQVGHPRRLPLPEDWTLWHPDLDKPHFLSVYVAGRNEGQAGLMRAAVRSLYLPESEPWYAAFGLPTDPERLLKAAQVVELAAQARAELQRLLDPQR